MKKVFLFFACIICNLIIQAQVIKTVTITSGNLYSSLSLAERQTVTDLTINGTIDAQDFHIMRDSMPLLENIDLSATTIASYIGTEGTNYSVNAPYLANEVPAYAFWNNVTYTGKPSLKSIILPASDTSIQSNAFLKCGALTSISIPNSVTSISNVCFSGCAMLNHVSLPASLTYLGDDAFMDCISLDSIAIPAGVISVNYSCFSGCTALKTVIFLGSTLSLVDQCFANCSSLQNIILPASLTSIGAFTFDGCTSLTTIDIPTYVTAIPMGAFKDCSSLSKITMPSTLTSIGDNAFNSCKKLQSFIVPKLLTNIGSSAFADCNSLTGFTLPEGLLTIGNSSFIQCTGISTMSIPSTTTAIGTNVFRYTNSKIIVNGANTAYSSLYGALYDKNKTTLYYIPTSIAGSFIIPETVTTIADNVFQNCNNLTSVTIPASVTTIGSFNFTYCALKTIKVLHSTPLDISNNSTIFMSFDLNNATLIVPAGTISLYAASAIWKKFGSIVDDNVTDGLVAFYPFNGNANDSTTNSNNGTVKGATLTADRFGIANAAYSFNGVNNYITIPNSSSLNINTDKVSIASWVKANNPNGYHQIISKAINTTDAGREFGMYLSSGYLAFETTTTNGHIDVTSSNSVTDQWAFLVSTYDGVAMKYYIDGVLVYSFPQTGNIVSLSSDLKIGIFGDGLQSPFDGAIDDIRIYNRAISESVIDSLYKVGGYKTKKNLLLQAGELSSKLTNLEKNGLESIALSGTIDVRDLITMRNMPNLKNIDISDVNIVSYQGTEGVFTGLNYYYGANEVPKSIFSTDSILQTIQLPPSTTSIGEYAFNGCKNMLPIAIPASVTTIGSSAFYECSAAINVDQTNQYYTSEDGVLFNKAKTNLIQCPISKTGDYTIPATVKLIKANSFYDCRLLNTLTIPVSVTTIEYLAFSKCSNITTVTFNSPSSLNAFEYSAFEACSSLTSIAIPASVTAMANNVFKQCTNLKTVSLSSSMSTIEASTFMDCSSLTTIQIPSSITTIRYWAFMNCTALESLPLETGTQLTSIEQSAFQNTGLTSFIIPSTVTNLGNAVFNFCSKIKTVTVPASITMIPEMTFQDCGNLTSVVLPSSITSIEKAAFYGCNSLNLTIPTAVKSIGFESFSGCSSLININIPNGDTSIGSMAFMNCSSAKNVSIPSLVKTIDIQAFYNCSGVFTVNTSNQYFASVDGVLATKDSTKIIACPTSKTGHFTVPTTVISYADNAFYNCKLTSIKVFDAIPVDLSANTNVFSVDYSKCILYVPYGSIAGYKTADKWNYFTNIAYDAYDQGIVAQYNFNGDATDVTSNKNDGTISNVKSEMSRFGKANEAYGFNQLSSAISVKSSSSLEIDSWSISAWYKTTDNTLQYVTSKQSSSNTNYLSIAMANGNVYGTLNDGNGEIQIQDIDKTNDGTWHNVVLTKDAPISNIVLYVDGKSKGSIPNSYVSVINNADFIIGNDSAKKQPWIGTIDDIRIYNRAVSQNEVDSLYHEGGYYDTVKTITVIPGGLSTALSDIDLKHITNLTVKGTIDARDFVTMNLSMPKLHSIDLSSASIISYTGTEGTNYGSVTTYGADTIPVDAFRNNYHIQSFISPTSITGISESIFNGCNQLKSVKLTDGIKIIGNDAFSGCGSLSNITLPASLEELGVYSFLGCYALHEISFPSTLKKIGAYAFEACNFKTISFPSSVQTIDDGAFYACKSLESAVMPESMTLISSGLFNSCPKLTSVILPTSLIEIKDYAFSGCPSLKSISFPSTLITIGSYSFYECTSLTSVNIPQTSALSSINTYAFGSCSALQTIDIPENMVSISNYAFSGCSAISSIHTYSAIPLNLSSSLNAFSGINKTSCTLNIPSGTMSAYLNAVVWQDFLSNTHEFDYVKKIISVTAGELNNLLGADMNTVTSLILSGTIDARDFETMKDSLPLLNYLDASAATIVSYSGDKGTNFWSGTVNYPANTVPEYGFDNKNSIKTIYLPKSTTKLDVVSFRGTDALLYIPASLTSLGNSVFAYAASKIIVDPNNNSYSSLDDVLYNKNKTEIIFCGTTKTGTFIIPPTVTSIGNNAFQSCSLLTNIIIPKQVDTIADGAFTDCKGLTAITLPDSLKTIGATAFENCQFTSVVIPEGVTSIFNSAFLGCNQIQTISLPKSLTFIGEDTFDDCSSLSLLKVSNTQPIDLSLFTTVFQNVNTATCTLQVPFQSTQFYNSAVNWKLFANITESEGIALNKHIVTVDNDGTTEKLSFLSNTNWSTTINANWLHFFTASAGSKDSSVTITIDQNTGIDREAYVVFSVNGQSDSVLISQKLECVSKPIVVGKRTVCEGDTVSLIVNSTNPLMWFDDATLTNIVASGQKYEVTPTSNTSLYVVQSATSNCTSLPTQVDIVINALPTIMASTSDNNICQMTKITFTGYGSDILNYKWDNGIPNGVPTDLYTGGSHTVTGTDINGCSATASVYVTVKQSPSITPKAITPYACFKDSIRLWGEGAISYEWDNGVKDSVPFSVTKNGNYYVTGTDANGCKATNSIYISMYNLPTVSISVNPKDSVTKGNQVTLTATGSIAVTSYIWDNGIFNNSIFTPSATQMYTVTATDYNACKAIDSIKIVVVDSIKTVTISAGMLSSLFSKTEKDYITCLTLSGNIDARDFKTMRDSMPKLQNIDLSYVTIDSYTGSLGTGSGSSNYSANEIPISAFANKTTIKSISLPYSATSIANAAFENCSNVTFVNFPSGITNVGAEAFYGTAITQINSPSQVSVINQATFKNCLALQTVAISPSVTTINSEAFANCAALQSINTYAKIPPTLASDAFTGIDKSTCKVLVPIGSLNAYKAAQGWKDFFSIEEFDTSHAPHFISGEIPQQYAMNGAMFYPIDFHQYITDEYTSIENLKFTIGQNDVMSFSMMQRMLIPKQIDSTWSGSTTVKVTVTNDANLSFDFAIVFTQPFLLKVPTVKPSCSFYASKMYLKLNQPTKFYATNKNTQSVEWTFDGGTPSASTSVTPIVSYDSTGLYSVTLKAINSIGETIVSKTGYIFVSALSVGDTTICKGDSIVISALGSGFSQYSWNTNPVTNAQSIKVSPVKTTTYKLTMKKGLATIVDSVTISIAKQPELGNDTTFCVGGSRILNPGIFLKYYWNGSSISGNATIIVTTAGKINVRTIDAKGCSEIDSITIGTLYPKPLVNLGKDSTFCWKRKLLLDAGNTGATYKWNTGITTKTILADTSKAYSVTVTDSKSCTNSDTINIKVIVPIVPQIGVITQSSTNKNIVAWEPINNKGVKLYHVWRQNSANVFEIIKTVLKQDSTYYIDNTSTPKVMSYQYALTTVDSACSNESNFSVVHGSVYLKCTMQADNKTINATWTNYEGIAVSKYILSRAEKGKPLQFLATVNADNGNSTTFPDGNSIGLNSYYQVSFELPNTITPSKLKSDSGPFSLSLSNMAESELTDETITIDESIQISPNPATDITTISVSENKIFTATLIDVLGHSILSQNGSGSIQIDCSQLKAGIYIVKILLDEKVVTSRLIVE
jgi:hypothetical protein